MHCAEHKCGWLLPDLKGLWSDPIASRAISPHRDSLIPIASMIHLRGGWAHIGKDVHGWPAPDHFPAREWTKFFRTARNQRSIVAYWRSHPAAGFYQDRPCSSLHPDTSRFHTAHKIQRCTIFLSSLLPLFCTSRQAGAGPLLLLKEGHCGWT